MWTASRHYCVCRGEDHMEVICTFHRLCIKFQQLEVYLYLGWSVTLRVICDRYCTETFVK